MKEREREREKEKESARARARDRARERERERERESVRDRKPLARQNTLFQLQPQSFCTDRFCIYWPVVVCHCGLYNHTACVVHAETLSEYMVQCLRHSFAMLRSTRFRS